MSNQEDLGRPATELRELLDAPDAGFLHRIRGSIHRRMFVSDTADFTFRVFFETLFDYLDLVMRSFAGTPRRPQSDREQD